MPKRTKVILIVIGVAVAAYLAYRWYQNRQANSPTAGVDTTGTGSNLNSAAPALTDASSGDNSAPQYSAGNETINVDLPNGDQSSTSNSTSNAPGGTTGGGPGPKPGPLPKPKPPVVHKPPPKRKLPIKSKPPVRHPVPVRQ